MTSGDMPAVCRSMLYVVRRRSQKLVSLVPTRRVGKGLELGAPMSAALSVDVERFEPGLWACLRIETVRILGGHAVVRLLLFFSSIFAYALPLITISSLAWSSAWIATEVVEPGGGGTLIKEGAGFAAVPRQQDADATGGIDSRRAAERHA